MSQHTHPSFDGDAINPSQNPSFDSVLAARLSRRQALIGGLSASAFALLGGIGLSACSDDDNNVGEGAPTALGFGAVAKSLADVVSVPTGYSATPLFRLGDPMAAGIAAFKNDGTDTDFDKRAGDHHDGMYYFGLAASGNTPDRNSSTRGLLVMNHEAITQPFLHPAGTSLAGPRPAADARKEMNAHGVSVLEVRRNAAGVVSYVQDSPLNRRITPFTEMDISGPVRGSDHVKTKFSTDGTKTRGTVNNCANGYTPWGTYLTCEENWPGYFKRNNNDGRSAAEIAVLARFGVPAAGSNDRHLWSTATPDTADQQFGRLNITVTGASAAEDYRNEVNTYGYVVEINPYDATSRPKKRTALGRFAHEGAWPAIPKSGEPVVFYMGDDNRGDYIYKYVSDAAWNPADANGGIAAGDKYLDAGTLYVAVFNADGSGEWKELTQGLNGLTPAATPVPFSTQADVIVATRSAADVVGATKMDRPEWAAVNPINGEVYLALTNNSNRGSASQPLNAANPRSYDQQINENPSNADLDGNPNGHIIRWKETGGLASALTFAWDVYVFAAPAALGAGVNLSKLTDDNDMSSPDGLWFSPASKLLWIQTDDGAYTNTSNCMMLAAIPGAQGDGAPVDVVSGAVTTKTYVGKEPGTAMRRFLVGPKGCEITGIAETPDGKTLFVNIQHPGEDISSADVGTPANYQSHWPEGGSARPRSATVVISKSDGGLVGL